MPDLRSRFFVVCLIAAGAAAGLSCSLPASIAGIAEFETLRLIMAAALDEQMRSERSSEEIFRRTLRRVCKCCGLLHENKLLVETPRQR